MYLGAALLVIVAAIFSSSGKKTPAQQAAAKGQPPQPTLQDNTDNNVQDLKNQLQAQRQKDQQQAALAAATGGDPALASATPAQRAAAAAYGPTGVAGPCTPSQGIPGQSVPGQPCPQMQQGNSQQLTPVQQQAQEIAAKSEARADDCGQQRRMAMVFHRLIMPDGYSVDLDQFHGLDEIGEEGLKDKVSNHYFEVFGASIALGTECRRERDLSGWWGHHNERLTGVHQRNFRQRLPIGQHHS